MDLITHGLSGLAAAGCVAAFADKPFKNKLKIGIAGLLGGILPDIDVISRWKHFDGTFGKLFGLTQSGRDIFFDTHWYSHHVFTHSIIGSFFFTLLGIGLVLMIKRIRGKALQVHWSYPVAFILGFHAHLFEDMITPPGPWQGIAYFWPGTNFSGGWNKIWWWNNYDLFLIVCAVLTINWTSVLISKKARIINSVTLLVGIALFAVQVERHAADRPTIATKNNEEASKLMQKKYLGETIYSLMERLDDKIPIAF